MYNKIISNYQLLDKSDVFLITTNHINSCENFVFLTLHKYSFLILHFL